jgi:ribonuclease R
VTADSLDTRLLAAAGRRRKPITRAALLRAARVGRREQESAAARLQVLEADGRLLRLPGDRWALPEQAGLVVGRLGVNPAGFGFVQLDDPARDDVHVAARAMGSAMHGDRVQVRVTRHGRAGRPTGRVVRVLARGLESLLAVYRPARGRAVLIPQDARITTPIVVAPGDDGGARGGDLVLARIVTWPERDREAVARVERVLGPADDPRVQTDAVIAAHDLPLDFPRPVAAAARRLPRGLSAADLRGRTDLRALPLVTIDGENARDFDDAVLVEALGAGFRLTVAVADVAHYVRADDVIDREARTRGTSVYFPDRVIPMLPEALSNDLCSLQADEDRLVQAVRMEFDAAGRLRAAEFHDAVMRSAARLTYTEVARALACGDAAARGRLGRLREPLEHAERLAAALLARRRTRGAIDFDLPEAEILLDLRGRPEQIVRAERNVAHRLIEECMLAANEAVARELMRRRIPGIHRVHEPPDPARIQDLTRFLEGFGLRLRLERGKATPAAFQAVIDAVEGRPEARLVHTVLLRAMQQARYAAEPLGHFGLALDAYMHFTSPIRRYPDLVAHRLLRFARTGDGRLPADLPAIAEESSRRERVAVDAEREIVQLKRVQFMQDKVGQQYDGVVSGVTGFGFFVELHDVFVEGLIHVGTLDDDFYEHDEARHLLRGRRTRRTIRVGDPVRVTVTGVSVARRQIDFVLADRHEETRPRWPRRARRS